MLQARALAMAGSRARSCFASSPAICWISVLRASLPRNDRICWRADDRSRAASDCSTAGDGRSFASACGFCATVGFSTDASVVGPVRLSGALPGMVSGWRAASFGCGVDCVDCVGAAVIVDARQRQRLCAEVRFRVGRERRRAAGRGFYQCGRGFTRLRRCRDRRVGLRLRRRLRDDRARKCLRVFCGWRRRGLCVSRLGPGSGGRRGDGGIACCRRFRSDRAGRYRGSRARVAGGVAMASAVVFGCASGFALGAGDGVCFASCAAGCALSLLAGPSTARCSRYSNAARVSATYQRQTRCALADCSKKAVIWAAKHVSARPMPPAP